MDFDIRYRWPRCAVVRAVDIRRRRSRFRFEQRQFQPFAFPLVEPELLPEEQVLFAQLADQEYVGAT